jgi:hypothetical protein
VHPSFRKVSLCVALCAAGVGPAAFSSAAMADRPVARASAVDVLERGDRGPAVRTLQRRLGITADGVFGPMTERAVRAFQRRRGLEVDGVVGPITARALNMSLPKRRASVRRSVPRSLRARLEQIAQCESGGNPRAVSANGKYRGKYQFLVETWRSVGGRGDPARASEREQDYRAAILYRRTRGSAWPNC